MSRWTLLLVVVGLSGCGAPIFGSGTLGTDSRVVALFTEARFSSGLTAVVKQGELSTVELSGDDNLLRLVQVSVTGNRLSVGLNENVSVNFIRPMTATVTVPRLEWVEASGAVSLTAPALSGDSTVTIEASGASTITLPSATAPTVKLTASGSSDITVSGTVQGAITSETEGASKVNIGDAQAETASFRASGSSTVTLAGAVSTGSLTASGASTIDALGLATKVLTVTAEGGSTVKAKAVEQARGEASGASTVIITGQPPVQQVSSSGASTVTFQ